jgi:hypothetical protein
MIENEIKKDIDIRPSSTLLWISILSGMIAFAIDMESRYALVQWACLTQRAWVIDLITVTAFIAAAAGAMLGWVAHARSDPAEQRARFMGMSGFILSAFFAFCILANDIPHIFLGTCD